MTQTFLIIQIYLSNTHHLHTRLTLERIFKYIWCHFKSPSSLLSLGVAAE